MLPSSVENFEAPVRFRFQEAYDKPKRPIGWWDPDKISVGLVQGWLSYLGYPLPKSVKVDERSRSGFRDLLCDGIFGQETFHAVMQFQTRTGIKADGMVGRNTLDKFSEELTKANRRHTPVSRDASVTVVEKASRPYKCPPGALICKEPP
jgi:hypothetical protein